MSADEPSATADRRTPSVRALNRAVDVRITAALAAVTVLSLSLRLFALGDRAFHWDEARVGYWILRYADTGIWEYHAVIHGPFLYHVNRYLFELFGASDFLARVPVAVVTGLLPLSAWLFRERLDGIEMIAVGLFFAANPVVLYYSRFMRNDVLLAAFMIYAFGCFVRLFDARRPRYLYAGTLMLAFAFTTKENVLVYLVAWLGAAVLLVDHRLVLVARSDDRRRIVRQWTREAWDGLRRWSVHLALAVALFAVVVIFSYAPRARGVPGPGFWKAFADPTLFPAVLEEATLGSWEKFLERWGGGNESSYLSTFEELGVVLRDGAAVLLAFAAVGFVIDRYRDDRPRDVVAFASYWGFASVLGYPVIVENAFPWEVVHAVVPLAIPAGVGVAVFVRWGGEAAIDGDAVSAALAALLVLVVAGQAAGTAYTASFVHHQDRYLGEDGTDENTLVQFGQPADGIRPTFDRVRRTVRGNDGVDVLYYGSDFYVADESDNERWAAGGGWYDRLPVPWYTEKYGAEVESTTDLAVVGDDPPPVVVARAEHRQAVAERLDGYRAYEEELTLWGSETVFFVDEDRLREGDGG